MKKTILFPLFSFLLFGCGVKGRPLPPETPREIGIGKPQYKGVDSELNQGLETPSKDDKDEDQGEP